MRKIIIIAALLILPQVVRGAPMENQVPVNGSATDATKIQQQKEFTDRTESRRNPASSKQDPSLVPCPQVSHEEQLEQLATLEKHSTTCPPANDTIEQDESGKPLKME